MDAITIILAGLDPDDYCDDCGETLDDGDCNSVKCYPLEDWETPVEGWEL